MVDYKQTDIGIFPEYWEVKSMGLIGDTIIGLTYSPNNVSKYGTLVLRSSNIQNNQLAFKDNVFVDMELPKRVIVNENDMLICVRNGSKRLIGKSVLIDKKTEGSAFGAFMSIYRSKINCFIIHVFQSHIIQKQINEILGATINQITNKDLASFQIPIPPLPEQEAIAEVLSDTDAMISVLEKRIAKKKLIKKGVIQKLLKPKNDWTQKALGEIALFHKGKGLPKSELKLEGKYKCVHYGELFDKHGEKIVHYKNFTNSIVNRCLSLSNDVLMPTSDVTPNGLATASCVTDNNSILGGDILIIRIPENLINGIFLAYFIKNQKPQVMSLVSGTTVYHIYASNMKNFVIQYPNIEEQNNISKILMDMTYDIDALEKKLSKTKELKQGLMQQLLTGKIRLLD